MFLSHRFQSTRFAVTGGCQAMKSYFWKESGQAISKGIAAMEVASAEAAIVETAGAITARQTTKHITEAGLQHSFTKEIIVKNLVSYHVNERFFLRDISQPMVHKALSKGSCYFDCKERTFAYILQNGFASGKTLHVGVNPNTGKITTVIAKRKFNLSVKFNNEPRFIEWPGGWLYD